MTVRAARKMGLDRRRLERLLEGNSGGASPFRGEPGIEFTPVIRL